ncbi:ClpXP protease specificity-enhancing factor SspB [Aestuariivirga sp.]|uniref:SspB family protein n=1 Tax=Aestuariivirga sp. TaxID=2650926 RepID=UPI003018721D
MPDDLMRYDLLAQNALKGVVREALRIAETTGLPGDHHFFIAFNTRAPGVELSDKIAARYPREMTIVLQHQYWNLRVHDDHFEVELSFDNVPEHLVIPFDAVKGFLDPAVQFGLQFEAQPAHSRPREVEAPKPAAAAKTELQPAPAAAIEDAPAERPAQDEAAKVVSLDQFRKK